MIRIRGEIVHVLRGIHDDEARTRESHKLKNGKYYRCDRDRINVFCNPSFGGVVAGRPCTWISKFPTRLKSSGAVGGTPGICASIISGDPTTAVEIILIRRTSWNTIRSWVEPVILALFVNISGVQEDSNRKLESACEKHNDRVDLQPGCPFEYSAQKTKDGCNDSSNSCRNQYST